jgi:APA family basic amino acid/polyamine antiporter
MAKQKDLGAFKRFVMPTLGVLGCLFMGYAAVVSHGMKVVWYLVIFAAIMLIGVFFAKEKKPQQ